MGRIASICHTCGGKGLIGGCPKCGKELRQTVQVQTIHLDVPADVIPVQYQGKLWTAPESTKETLPKFIQFDGKLEAVLREFLSGRVPKFSMYIGTPPKYGKHMFAYSCLQTALVQQHSIAPLLSTSDWRRLYRVSQVNPFYKLYDKYKWDDLVMRDVVFIAVDHSDDRMDVISLLKDIYDVRAGFNLPTFVLSDYKLHELVPAWGKEMYTAIYNPDPNRDLFRYPVIIQRFE